LLKTIQWFKESVVSLKDKIVNSEQLINTIKENLKANLPEHMQPKEVYIIDNMPVTLSGKIDYLIITRVPVEHDRSWCYNSVWSESDQEESIL
jgi:acyl-coenzyme A synthetase/AMP-(fatty) acid ligase